jgi:hypothetical protein
MYEDVHDRPVDAQEIQFASMLDRLETGNDCLSQPYVTPGAACDSACGETSCCTPCEPCCESSCYAGFAAVWIRPHFHQDTAFVIDPTSTCVSRSFDRNFEITPRVWLGYTDCDGFGVRAQYWQYDHDADPQSIVGTATNTPISATVFSAVPNHVHSIFADADETLIAQHSLLLQAFDLEATKQFRRCRSSAVAGIGLRYARMEQEFNARVFDDGGAFAAQVVNQHDFEGIGPTASLWLHQQFGCSNWGGYGSLRGSVLFGDRNDTVSAVTVGDPTENHFYNSRDVMGIGEIGFGVQYSRCVTGNSIVFVRGGYEGQIWFDAGGPLSIDGNLGLEGLVLSFGVEI